MTTILENSTKNFDISSANPVYHSRFQKLERALNDLFMKELNSEKSIFIKFSPNIVRKIAIFLSGVASRPASIGFCGETASGKSTIVLDSIDTINDFSQEFLLENIVTRINTDDYYFDRSKEVEAAGSFAEFTKHYDLDVPEAIELSLMKEHIEKLLNKESVYLPRYDMSGTAKRFDNEILATPSPIIISEGVFTLVDKIADIFDFKIYVDVSKDVQRKRFFERAEQRGLGDSACDIFENASQKADIYIRPCAKIADIVLNGEAQRERYKQFISSFLFIIESSYYSMMV